MQSSSADGGIPQRAVDGSSGQIYSPQTCTLTRPELRPWWYVNLLEPYMVQLVRLDFGKSCCGKLYIHNVFKSLGDLIAKHNFIQDNPKTINNLMRTSVELSLFTPA